ncbi:hypothetical protein L3049_04075 [Labilibaculum sp. DW002]|uniref:MotA/TolQ/ExbB proton channel domain-containing protein n=1 Tax=Paralabilibaculum antarcticum TaxID=2912572 RepID=A0ABT5VQV1_9BACT|nr:hypothetical protein [Labilibaculum sp. DW002]MDE5417177.1 hypothetical protein [Labilibaculum sp. DW002]
MFDFFIKGGIAGMSIVMLSGIGAIIWSIISTAKFSKKGFITKRHLDAILFLGSFSFFIGILWQGIGLSEVLSIIQGYPNISPEAIAAGLRVSMISAITGAILFAISAIFWICLRYLNNKKAEI